MNSWTKTVMNDWANSWGMIQWNSCESENLKKVKELVADGADVNIQDERGFTPLMWASYYGQTKIVKELIAHDADLNKQDEVGGTALLLAVSAGPKNMETIKALIDAGADMSIQDNEGWTALKTAVGARYGEISRLLNEAERRKNASKIPTPIKIGGYSLMVKMLDPKVTVSVKEHE